MRRLTSGSGTPSRSSFSRYGLIRSAGILLGGCAWSHSRNAFQFASSLRVLCPKTSPTAKNIQISTRIGLIDVKILGGSNVAQIGPPDFFHQRFILDAARSEERRVGKEGRSRWSPYN